MTVQMIELVPGFGFGHQGCHCSHYKFYFEYFSAVGGWIFIPNVAMEPYDCTDDRTGS